MIRMHAEIDLDYVANENCTFVLNVQPASTQRQTVVEETLELPPYADRVETSTNEEKTRFVRFTAGPGPVRVSSRFVVDLDLRIDGTHGLYEWPASRLPMETLRYVHPSRYCESEKLMTFAVTHFGCMQPGYQRVAAIRDWVRANVAFRIGTTRWDTAASDILDQREGVCRDFAHLMIALCRALNIPARFATGIDYGADPQLGPVDFHAYVEAFVGGRWYLFDPTGISPTTGLIRLGTGRDAADVAFATIFGNVISRPPRIAITAAENRQAGIVLPWHTEHAVSTADDLPAVGTDPQQTFSRRHARPLISHRLAWA